GRNPLRGSGSCHWGAVICVRYRALSAKSRVRCKRQAGTRRRRSSARPDSLPVGIWPQSPSSHAGRFLRAGTIPRPDGEAESPTGESYGGQPVLQSSSPEAGIVSAFGWLSAAGGSPARRRPADEHDAATEAAFSKTQLRRLSL